MLTKLEIKLSLKEDLSYQDAPLFHGAVMEVLPEEYAAVLHQSRLHPYAQHLEKRKDGWYWILSCLNTEAAKKILYQSILQQEYIEIKKKNLRVEFSQKQLEELSGKTLMDAFYRLDSSPYIQIHFITPTAFKQQGRYLFYPDLRCIYQSLMNKYDASLRDESMADEDTLEQLVQNSEIIRYDLKSTGYQMGAVQIPSFIGKITIKVSGTKTMANFANLLFRFGEYSGVGIKTSLGMGAFRIVRREKE